MPDITDYMRPGLLQLPWLPPLSLYVHLPWCLKKCPYCDFNSHEFRGQDTHDALPQQRYVDALIADLETSLPWVWGRPVYSVFLGGGTPSLFSPAAIDRLIGAIRARLPLEPDCEITLEANPGTFEKDRFRAFRQAGVTRLSVGVQSFSDRHLQALGRVHDRKQAMEALAEAAAHFPTFNLDLMYALPGQTLADLDADLDTALIEREHAALFPGDPSPPPEAWLAAAAAASLARGREGGSVGLRGDGGWVSPWAQADGWRASGAARRVLRLRSEAGGEARVAVRWDREGPGFELEDAPSGIVRATWQDDTTLVLESANGRQALVVVRAGAGWQGFAGEDRIAIEVLDELAPRAGPGAQESHLRAPMPGRVLRLLARPGAVERGAPLLVLEAMKMEHTVLAPAAGELEAFNVQAGDQVAEGDDLVQFRPTAAPAPTQARAPAIRPARRPASPRRRAGTP